MALIHFVWIYLIKIFDCHIKVNYHGRGKSKLLWALVWRSGLTGYTMHDIKFRSLCFSPALLYLEVLSWNVLKISLFFWLCPEMSWNLLSKVLEKMEKCPEKSWNVLKFEFWKSVDTMNNGPHISLTIGAVAANEFWEKSNFGTNLPR